ncbi:MAG: alanine racemase [Myxococcales bacterium]|nr:alanine racemase [Myxococcales bacterium]MDH5566106.1 alanine racemase [Myxococcales bacterium]
MQEARAGVAGRARSGSGGSGVLAAGRPTEAAIDRAALRANYAEVRRLAGDREVIAVVKTDAYGHGAACVAQTLVAVGCPRFATATVEEGVALREAGIDVPVLVLGGVHDVEEAREAAARGLTPVVHDGEQLGTLAAALRGAAAPLSVHVEIDTGMRRMGVAPDSALGLLTAVANAPALALAGVYTHFARADEPDLSPSLDQLLLFRELLAAARARGIDPGLVHFANSAPLLVGAPLLDAMPSDAVRPGLMLYGVSPAADLTAELRPVMTLRTRVVALRTLLKGEGVGYSASFRARRDTRVATLPVGYGDAIPVAASNRAMVLIRGRRLPVVGRVSMDYVSVDVGELPVAPGDEAIVFGVGQGTALPVEEAAAAAHTIAYELLVRVGSRVRRVLEG